MTICIFHDNCIDGFAAAWVVRKALGDIHFHAAQYQTPPPPVDGKDAAIVDFSYPRQVLLEMAEKANSILILDHHKTAEQNLVDLPANVTTRFDMDHCGAVMAWKFYFPRRPPPQLLLHIEDHDLWRHSLHNTREIIACLSSYPYDFNLWDQLMGGDLSTLVADGVAIERLRRKEINQLIGSSMRHMRIGGHKVPVANVPPSMVSLAAGELAKGRPFAGCYHDTSRGRVFSLRSTNDGLDVSEIAKLYGGGGHRNAAGFTVSFDQARAFEG